MLRKLQLRWQWTKNISRFWQEMTWKDDGRKHLEILSPTYAVAPRGPVVLWAIFLSWKIRCGKVSDSQMMNSNHVKNRNGGVSKNGEAHAMAISMAEPAAYLGILPRSQKSAGWLTGWAAVIGSIRMEIAVIPTETLLISNTKIMHIIRIH